MLALPDGTFNKTIPLPPVIICCETSSAPEPPPVFTVPLVATTTGDAPGLGQPGGPKPDLRPSPPPPYPPVPTGPLPTALPPPPPAKYLTVGLGPVVPYEAGA